ncbi:hypothetical protein LWI28_025683 [Acer negundo]|uniref:Cytochrome P450 n=1 Tax=Acer negundo TaxID=4023 RepID=A0AAD5NVL2_ACENE|nr:hypothetical protein LWI28_025683 [Acer negundo]KAK4848019.1 hypothetical protein QYF36_008221 [Acer negundo]
MHILIPIFIFIAFSLLCLLIIFSLLILKIYTGKSIKDPTYPPVNSTVFGQLFYFNRLYDYQTEVARKQPTFRLLAPSQSEIYTTDTRNIEHVLKTKFDKYSKGKYNQDIVTDLFGQGIFAVDGEKWKQQRKLASFEFSTRVLRDFSCVVFRRNAAKLVNAISEFAVAGRVFDMQDILMRCTLDSIFKVGFGVDLNCLDGSSKEGTEFMKAFDDSNALVYRRYVDPFWKLKRFLNIGTEASLKNNIKIIDDFVHKLISTKRNQLNLQQYSNDKEDILSRFLLASEKDPEKMNDEYLRDIILNFMIAALTETLRLYPAVPMDGRCAETDDILPDGFSLKKGDGVYYMAYAMGRMDYIWGDDAEEFRPERWLVNGIFQPESPFKFIAFHAGPRICLGKDFAYRQMKIVSMAVLHFFHLKLADETKNVTYKTMFTLHIDGGLHLRAISRT